MDEERYYYVYCHTNKINGKKYIGISLQNPFVRWQNGKGYKTCTKFYTAIQKYGWENFAHEILIDHLTVEEASCKEKEYIKLFDTINNGYNFLEGGIDGLQEWLCKPINQYSLDKTLIATWKSAMDIERKLKYKHSAITAVCRRERKTSHNYIWRYSDDCDDIDDIILDKRNKYKNKTSLNRKINQYDLDGKLIKQWDNLLQIAHTLNKTTTVLLHCCNRDKHYYTAYGYQWRYADNCDDISAYNKKCQIYELDNDNKIVHIFNTIAEIEQFYNDEKLYVSDVLTHKYYRTKGHKFIYSSEY